MEREIMESSKYVALMSDTDMGSWYMSDESVR